MKKIIYLSFLLLFTPVNVFANTNAGGASNNTFVDNKGGYSDQAVTLDNPLDLNKEGLSIQQLIGRILRSALGVVGSLALAMFVYGGFVWMLAAGNPSNVEKGKQILVWATIGLVVIFSAYAMLRFVFEGLGVG